MRTLVASLSLLIALISHRPVGPEPWNWVEVEGVILYDSELECFDVFEIDDDGDFDWLYELGFATKQDHNLAHKSVGKLVRIRGFTIECCRAVEFLAVHEMREVTRPLPERKRP